jgi:hypothetical protein
VADGDVIVPGPPSWPKNPFPKGNKLASANTLYTPELGEQIVDLISTTSRGLKWLCRNIDGMPSYLTVLKWEGQHQAFGRAMALARRQQALTLVDECMEIADDTSRDHYTYVSEKHGERELPDLAGIARAKIMIDTRIRLAKMFDPQRFGDRLDISAKVGGFASQDDVIDDLG